MRLIRRKRGFSLIEVLIALVVLVIGVVGTVVVIPSAQRSMRKAGLASETAIALNDVMSELKNKGAVSLANDGPFSGTKGIFSWEATVLPVAADDFVEADIVLPTNQDMLKLYVRVSYVVNNKPLSEEAETFYFDL